jgi:flagellar hook-length control protein FliK
MSQALPTMRVIHFALHPEVLGPVTVRLRLAGSRLELAVEVHEPESVEALEKDRQALANALHASGYSVEALTISVAPTGPAAQNALQQPPQHPGAGGGHADASPQENSRAGAGSERGRRFDGFGRKEGDDEVLGLRRRGGDLYV